MLRSDGQHGSSSSSSSKVLVVSLALLTLLLARSPSLVDGQSPQKQFRRELRYLNYYLGIAPANEDGAFFVDGEWQLIIIFSFYGF